MLKKYCSFEVHFPEGEEHDYTCLSCRMCVELRHFFESCDYDFDIVFSDDVVDCSWIFD